MTCHVGLLLDFIVWPVKLTSGIWILQDCLALGVIFAATDSVAVLQVLKQDRTPLLYSLVFGEGVMNDATAVALLRAVQVSPSVAFQKYCFLVFSLSLPRSWYEEC